MRLFAGIDLPWELRHRLAALTTSGIQGARWVPPENYHLTLRFIGEVPPHRAEEIDLALAAIRGRRLELTLAGVGTFAKGGRANTLWVGLERNPRLEHLQNKIETALQRAGLEPERRRFQPHVTLARLRNPDGARMIEWLAYNALYTSAEFPVDVFRLYSSRLTSDGSVYAVEREYPLEARDAKIAD